MLDIQESINYYIMIGYSYGFAVNMVSQDIILSKIAKSKLRENITIKGGIVMFNITKNKRRTTKDIDIDLIKYSLADESLYNMINILNNINDGIEISILGDISLLKHQDYKGKRVNLKLKDKYGHNIQTTMDIGIHSDLSIIQDEFVFEIETTGESLILLINSKEQILVEKILTLLKLGVFSTRYKDIYDIYIIIKNKDLDTEYLDVLFNKYILNNDNKYINYKDIYLRLESILTNPAFKKRASNPKYKWIDEKIDNVVEEIITFIKDLEKINV